MPNYIIAETDILENEFRQYELVALLLKKKQKYLVESNPDGIRQITCEIEEAIMRIRNLEKERSKLLDGFISNRLTRPAPDVKSWQKAFPDEEIDEKKLIAAFRSYDDVKAKLRTILQDVSELQDTNRLLIQQGREVLQSCIECLLSQVSSETYDSTGAQANKVKPETAFLDQRI